MKKQFTVPPHMQNLYSKRFGDECDSITISWNKELYEWYPLAIQALDFASIATLQVPSVKYPELFKKESHGLNMNIVAALANNLELRTPSEMGMSAEEWAGVIKLNDEVGKTWNMLAEPVHTKLQKEFEIMMSKPRLVVPGEA